MSLCFSGKNREFLSFLAEFPAWHSESGCQNYPTVSSASIIPFFLPLLMLWHAILTKNAYKSCLKCILYLVLKLVKPASFLHLGHFVMLLPIMPQAQATLDVRAELLFPVILFTTSSSDYCYQSDQLYIE